MISEFNSSVIKVGFIWTMRDVKDECKTYEVAYDLCFIWTMRDVKRETLRGTEKDKLVLSELWGM